MPASKTLMSKTEWQEFRKKVRRVRQKCSPDDVLKLYVEKAGLKKSPVKIFYGDWDKIVRADKTPTARTYGTIRHHMAAFRAAIEDLAPKEIVTIALPAERAVYTVVGPDGHPYTGVGAAARYGRFEGCLDVSTIDSPPPTGCRGLKCVEAAVQRLWLRSRLTNRTFSRICDHCDSTWWPRFVEAADAFGQEIIGAWTPTQVEVFLEKFLADERDRDAASIPNEKELEGNHPSDCT